VHAIASNRFCFKKFALQRSQMGKHLALLPWIGES